MNIGIYHLSAFSFNNLFNGTNYIKIHQEFCDTTRRELRNKLLNFSFNDIMRVFQVSNEMGFLPEKLATNPTMKSFVGVDFMSIKVFFSREQVPTNITAV